MQAATVISSLSSLPLWKIEDKQELYILIDDILGILRANRSPNDQTKDVKRDNIQRELKCHKEGITEKDGQNYCSLTSLYRYCFNHYDGFEFCKTVCNEITLQTLSSSHHNSTQCAEIEHVQDKSTLNLYKTLLNSKLLDDLSEDYAPDSESDVRFLVTDYKNIPEFQENGNWAKILLFEEQFQNFCSVTHFETLSKRSGNSLICVL